MKRTAGDDVKTVAPNESETYARWPNGGAGDPIHADMPMYDELTQRVIDHISQVHGVDADTITPESTFEELDIDSLGAMSLVADLEIEMGVEVPNEELLKIRTVGQAAESLSRVLAETEAAPQG